MVLFAKYIIAAIIVPRYASFLHKQKITVNFDQLVVQLCCLVFFVNLLLLKRLTIECQRWKLIRTICCHTKDQYLLKFPTDPTVYNDMLLVELMLPAEKINGVC